MKKSMILMVALMFSALSLNAADGQIKREFTVTQLALDTQNAQMAQEEAEDDSNDSTEETQPEGGDAEK